MDTIKNIKEQKQNPFIIKGFTVIFTLAFFVMLTINEWLPSAAPQSGSLSRFIMHVHSHSHTYTYTRTQTYADTEAHVETWKYTLLNSCLTNVCKCTPQPREREGEGGRERGRKNRKQTNFSWFPLRNTK